MINTHKVHMLLLCLLYALLGCSDDGGDSAKLLLPSDLAVQVTVDPANHARVEVQASAENANFYSIYFGEEASETPVKVNDGKATHTYSASGTYTIKVQAHATVADFITNSQTVTITQDGSHTDVEIPTTGYTSPESYTGMNLVWQDEFAGSELSGTNWTHESGTGSNGWGNNELQYYRQQNTTVQDGYLIITARKENMQGSAYTSSRIITKDKRSFQYGRIDIRAVLPKGQGIWPALWMLGSDFSTAGWPACGEIDIMEMVGGAGRENTVHGTLHWDNGGSHACTCDKPGYTLDNGTFGDEFHVFSIVWDETHITWYVDDVQFNSIDITPGELSEFHNRYFFIFNVAVGGNWPGSPDATSTFPQRMIVDYVRVFQEQ